ncbi:MAG: thioredoxin fold domain-containing protein [Bacteroidota bacterium]
MKKIGITLLILATVWLPLVAEGGYANTKSQPKATEPGIVFEEGNWESILAAAKKQNKLIFLDAYTTWCRPCKMMELFTFTDAKVAEYYNTNFINARIDMEGTVGEVLAERYNVRAFPNLLFINGDGELVHRSCGALEATEFIQLGEHARDPSKQFGTLKNQYESGEHTASFISTYAQALREACLDADQLIKDYFNGVPEDQLILPEHWDMIKRNVSDIFSKEFNYLIKHQKRFIEKYGEAEVNDKIFATYLHQYNEILKTQDASVIAMKSLNQLLEQSVAFEGKRELQNDIALNLADYEQDWDTYAKLVLALIDEVGLIGPEKLNEFAWKFYLHIDDPEQLGEAIKWMEHILVEQSTASIMDTYASLLHKTGKNEQAIEWSKKALEAAEQEGQELEHYQKQHDFFLAGG